MRMMHDIKLIPGDDVDFYFSFFSLQQQLSVNVIRCSIQPELRTTRNSDDIQQMWTISKRYLSKDKVRIFCRDSDVIGSMAIFVFLLCLVCVSSAQPQYT